MATISSTKYRYPAPPRAVLALIAINIVVAIAIWIGDGVREAIGLDGERLAEMLTLPPYFDMLGERPWTLLTYMFTQVSALHLIFNMLWLYIFGVFIARVMQGGRIVAIYLSGGIAGGLLYIIGNNDATTLPPDLTGASAAVIAIITVTACRMPEARVRLVFGRTIRLIWPAIIALILCLENGLDHSPALPAHLGGLIAGLVFGLERFARKRPDTTDIYQGDYLDRSISGSKGRADNRARLDQLLDKIRLSGYESLSKSEKDELNRLSQHV